MNLLPKSFYGSRRIAKALRLFFMIAGPGIIVMVADNDAGGITTYSVTGAQYGMYLLWFLILLGPVAYYVQEMTVRLGAVTKRGHAEAIFTAFGKFWGWFSLLDLVMTDWLTMITEYIGMTAAMGIFHIPALVTVVVCWIIMGSMMLSGRYWTWEKITLGLCVLNMIYVPAAFMVHPSVHDIIKYSCIPNLPPGGLTNALFFMLMANIGTTIAPWMLFFQQSSVVDKGLGEKDIKCGKIDTLIGAFFTVLVAVVLIIVCGTLLRGQDIQDAAAAAIAIMPTSKWIGTIVAIGLFDAGLLGAVCISLASSWAFGEVFGWAHSLNNKIREAPWFYAYYFFDLLLAGVVTLLASGPLRILITLFVQVIATTLMPAALVFLILLLNDRKTMGVYCNTLYENIVNIVIVVIVILTSTLYGLSALFPSILNDPHAAGQGVIDFFVGPEGLPVIFRHLHWTPQVIAAAVIAAAVVIEFVFLLRAGRWPRWSAIANVSKGIARIPLAAAIRAVVAAVGGSWLGSLWRGLAAWMSRSRPGRLVHLTREQFRGVSRKYAKPEIETTRFAKFCLLSLRVYLFVLIGLMIFKFIVAAI